MSTQRADADRCPGCGRKAALRAVVDLDSGTVLIACRWCDYKRATVLPLPADGLLLDELDEEPGR